MNWIIYYSDGSTFNSEQGAWEDAPGRDVQIILYRHPRDGWIMRHGGNTRKGDYFRIDGDHVVGMDFTGVLDHVVYELGIIKEGRMLNPDHWQEILRQATLDIQLMQREMKDGAT